MGNAASSPGVPERLAIRRQHYAAVGFDLSFERSRR